MKITYQKALALLALAAILLPTLAGAAIGASEEPDYILRPGKTVTLTLGSPQVQIGDEAITLDAAPYTKKSTTMVPLRFICQDILGAAVSWDQGSGDVVISDGKQVVMINSAKGVASKDGVDYPLTQAPEVVKDRTFVPLRLVAELFDCTVNYDGPTRTITIITPDRIVYLPRPDFTLQGEMIAGQKPVYSDQSHDPEGGVIVDRIWRVSRDDKSLEGRELSHLIGSRPEPGQYLVQLRAKSSSGLWSNWHTGQTLTVLPNKAPRILGFRANKSAVDIGEGLTFTFDVDNEPWEDIVEYAWSHTSRATFNAQSRQGLPRAFFEAGVVDVELVVKDAYGNESEKASFSVTVSDKTLKTEMQFKFQDPRPGERFLNIPGTNYNLLPYAEPRSVATVPTTLLMSNNPERVPSAGILYQDKAEGPVRLSYSHLNTLNREMFIAVFAENAGPEPVTMTINKRGLAGPSGDVLQVGQQVVASYFRDNTAPETVVIKPGQSIVINSGQEPIKREQLLAGIIDLDCDAPLLFTVAAVTEGLSKPSYAGLPPLGKERTHVRGTFADANLRLSYHVDGVRREKIVIGREDAYEGHFLPGIDNLTGERLENKGNWAVMHEITISSDRRVGVLLNPRGAMYKGALIGFDGRLTLISDSGHLQSSREAVVLGVIGAGETKTIKYTAPGGSDAPILLVIVPESEW